MSEVLIPASAVARTQFGLQVINEQPVRLIQNPPDPTVTAVGSAGRDSFIADPSSTTPFRIQGGAGDDTIVTGAAADVIQGEAGNDSITANAGNDSIAGGLNNDILLAGDGDDFVTGDEGNDGITGGLGDDVLDGGLGNDQISGGAGANTLRGGEGNDTLSGNDGEGRIEGGGGSDILNAGEGRSILRGGTGRDRFRFDGASVGDQLDRIADFKPREDSIEISRGLLPGSGLRAGKLRKTDFQVVEGIRGSSPTAKIVYDSNSGIVYYNPTRGVDVPLFQMQKNLDVSAGSFRIF
ncbi:hypothetical protein IFO70_01435 [Phormidium tenue FACHB-886]|nr:hypothetical protein [Phormidium tenue FACHB-886]